MVNKTQRFKMVTLLKSLKLEPLVQLVQLAYWFFLMILIKQPFHIVGSSCMALVMFISIQIVFP